MLWRRSYDMPPPPITDSNEYSQAGDPRYADLGDDAPKTECLADVVARLEPYLYGPIADDLAAGRMVLVAAHGNSLRAVVKLLDGISDEDIAEVNIPTGIPLKYELDADLRAADRRWRPTWTPRPPLPRSPRSPTRAAEPTGPAGWPATAGECLR